MTPLTWRDDVIGVLILMGFLFCPPIMVVVGLVAHTWADYKERKCVSM